MKSTARSFLFLILIALAGGAGIAAEGAGAGRGRQMAPPSLGTPPTPVTPVSKELAGLVKGNTAFAVALYKQLAKEKEGSLFFSPYSISTAVAMTYAGARGQTAEQIAQVFSFKGIDNLHPLVSELQQATVAQMKNGLSLDVANALWGAQGYQFNDDFLALQKKYYGGEVQQVNFGENVKAAETINKWVAGQTQDKIKDLIDANDLSFRTVLVQVNAVYFKAAWASPFEEQETRDDVFELDARNHITVPMMHKMEDVTLPYYADEQEKMQVLELPYADRPLPEGRIERLQMRLQPTNENGLVMDVILPYEVEGLSKLDLSAEKLERWLAGLKPSPVTDITIPKFEMKSAFRLNDTLSAMGMPDAFQDGVADLTGMKKIRPDKKDLYIHFVVHQAWVKVDEKGTEAAAATAIGSGRGGRSPWPEFVANHPFLFLIRDKHTGNILFMGKVAKPAEAKEAPPAAR